MDTRRWLYERALETLQKAVATRDPWERARLLLEAVALRDLSDDYEPAERRALH